MARKVRIELVLDAKGAVKGVKSIDGAVDDLDVSIKKTRKGLSTFKAALGVAFFAAAARGAARFAARMFELGSSVEETASKFNTVFAKMAGSVDEFGETFANMAGLTKREFRDLASVTGSILQGVGADLATSAVETERILRLAADLASFNNVSIQEAFAAIRSGLVGQSEPLQRYGILLDATKTKTEALRASGKKNQKQLTELEKVQARLTLAIRGAGAAVGDQERTMSSAANEAKRFNAVIREQEELLATALLPALNDVRRAFSETVIENREAVEESITFFGSLASKTVTFLGGLLGAFNRFFAQVQFRLQTGLIIIESTISSVLKTVASSVQLINTGLESIGITGIAAIDRFAASARNAAGFLDDVVDERFRRQLEAMGITMGEAAGGADALTEALGGPPGGGGGGDGGGGGGGGKKGLKGIVETLKDEIKNLAFHVRDLTTAGRSEVEMLLAKRKELERELFLRKQLLGFIGGPVEPEAVPVRGPDLPGGQTTLAGTENIEAQIEAAERLIEIQQLRRDVDDDLAEAQAQNLRKSVDFISEHFRQVKAFAVAEAIANTFNAANVALASAPPPENYILMAAVIAAGLANVSSILSASPGGGVPGSRGSTAPNATSSTPAALGGIRVQDRGFTIGATGAALGARAPLDLRIEVIEKDLFTINVMLKNADGVRDQVGSI